MTIGAVILAGGKSSRMGCSKADLLLDGNSFLDKIAEELSEFPELLISVDKLENHTGLQYNLVDATYPDSGTMAGVISSFAA